MPVEVSISEQDAVQLAKDTNLPRTLDMAMLRQDVTAAIEQYSRLRQAVRRPREIAKEIQDIYRFARCVEKKNAPPTDRMLLRDSLGRLKPETRRFLERRTRHPAQRKSFAARSAGPLGARHHDS
jgi:hypothetical protein